MNALRDLWESYNANRGISQRNRLVDAYMPLVRLIAFRLKRPAQSILGLDDLVSEGTLGLMAAIAGFDPSRGLKFETYAGPKIRGAMLDALRKADWVPRSVRDSGAEPIRTEIFLAIAPDQDDPLTDARSRPPIEELQAREVWQTLIGPLPRELRLILTLIYREDFTWKEAGAVIGVCESMISRLHSMALRVLRARHSHLKPDPAI